MARTALSLPPGRRRVLKRRIDRQRQNKTIKEHKKVARFESVAAAGVRTFVSVKRMRQQTGYDMESSECEFRTMGIVGRGLRAHAPDQALYLLSLRVGRLIFLAAGDQ